MRRRPRTGPRIGDAVTAGVIAIATTAAGCSGDDAAGGAAAGGFRRPPTPVEIAEVRQGPVADRFDAVGTITANEEITVVSEVPGKIARMPFEEGSRVAEGALLAQLDDAELRAALSRAEAIGAQKKAAYERVERIAGQGAGSAQDLDDAVAELAIAEADIALARARLAKTRILAPFAGRTSTKLISPGAFVQPGTPITELSDIGVVKVVFTAPERFVPKLAPGAPVRISTTAYPDDPVSGTVQVVDPVLDPETRSVEVIAVAENTGERLRPGMSADVSAILSQRLDALTIPSEAVFAEGDQTLVFVVNPDSTVARAAVRLGTRLEADVEVLDGLTAGQRVVRAGHQKLFPGARVMPIQSGGATEPAP